MHPSRVTVSRGAHSHPQPEGRAHAGRRSPPNRPPPPPPPRLPFQALSLAAATLAAVAAVAVPTLTASAPASPRPPPGFRKGAARVEAHAHLADRRRRGSGQAS